MYVSKIFVPLFHLNRIVEWLDGIMAFARFEMVLSILAPDQPIVRSIVSFLARRAYT